jgi:hypothetical protein
MSKSKRKVKNPDGKMTVKALFYNTVHGTVIIDNTSGRLHEAGAVFDGYVQISGSDALEAIWEFQEKLGALDLSLEVVSVGKGKFSTRASAIPAASPPSASTTARGCAPGTVTKRCWRR